MKTILILQSILLMSGCANLYAMQTLKQLLRQEPTHQTLRQFSTTTVFFHPTYTGFFKRSQSAEEMKKLFRSEAKKCHPDLGGNSEDFKNLNKAYEQALDGIFTESRYQSGTRSTTSRTYSYTNYQEWREQTEEKEKQRQEEQQKTQQRENQRKEKQQEAQQRERQWKEEWQKVTTMFKEKHKIWQEAQKKYKEAQQKWHMTKREYQQAQRQHFGKKSKFRDRNW